MIIEKSSYTKRLSFCLVLPVVFLMAAGLFRIRSSRSNAPHSDTTEASPQPSNGEQPNGFLRRSFRDTDGGSYTYVVFVPPSRNINDETPVMLYLNGYGENGTDGLAPLYNSIAFAIWEYEKQFPFIVVWAQCENGDAWTNNGPSTRRALSILRQVIHDFRADPNRVYLSGISKGAAGVWSIAAGNPGLFAAIVPISADGASQSAVSRIVATEVPVWSYAVKEDRFSIQVSTEAHRQMLKKHISPRFTELQTDGDKSRGEHDAWTFAFRDLGLYRWLATQSLANKSKQRAAFVRIDPPLCPDIIKPTLLPHGSHSALEVQAKAEPQLCEVMVKDLDEVHLEFRPDSGICRFSVGFFNGSKEIADSGTTVDLAIDDFSSGGVYSWPTIKCQGAGHPLAERSIRRGGWNDLRITFNNGTITTEVNGFHFLSNATSGCLSSEARMGLFACGTSENGVSLRNIRVSRRTHPDQEPLPPDNGMPEEQIDNRGEDASQVIDIPTIERAWSQREQSSLHVNIEWRESTDSRFATAQPSFEHQEAKQLHVGPSSRLTIFAKQFEFSAPWPELPSEFWRRAGISCVTKDQLFKRAFRKRFGNRTRIQRDTLNWSIKANGIQWAEHVFSDTDKISQAFICNTNDILHSPIADLHDVFLRTFLLTLRPLSAAGPGGSRDGCRIVSTSALVDATRCVVVEVGQVDGEGLKRRYWVDPARDFLIVRTDARANGVVFEQVDIRYSQDLDRSWAPKSLLAIVKLGQSVQSSGARFAGADWLLASSTASVTQYHSLSAQAATTQISPLPIGTILFNRMTGEWARQISGDKLENVATDEIHKLIVDDN